MKEENNSQIITCAECKFWTEQEEGWGTCREIKNIMVLGGVWWPEKSFGCINAVRKEEKADD